MSTFCEWEKVDDIVYLKLTGADGHHYLTAECLKELCSQLAKIRQEPCRALITTSSTGSFSDGINYEDLNRGMNPAKQAKVLSDGMAAVVKELLEMPMLTVCAATGDATSLGLALALAHDYFVVLSGAYYRLGMVVDGVAVQPYIAALIREKTDGFYTVHTLQSLWRTGNWMRKWYFADCEAGSPDDVLGEAKKIVEEWDGSNGEVHADMRKQLYRQSWHAVSDAVHE